MEFVRSVVAFGILAPVLGSVSGAEVSGLERIVSDHRGLNHTLTTSRNVLLEPCGGIDTLRITASQSAYRGAVTLHQAIRRLVCQGNDTVFQKVIALNSDASLDLEFPVVPDGVVYTNVIPNAQRGAINCRFFVKNGNNLKVRGNIISTDEKGCEFSTTAF
jgi:hypothetical protein